MTRNARRAEILAGAFSLAMGFLSQLSAQTIERKLTPVDGAEEDRFGTSVAVSGDFLIVGSPQDDDNGMNSGSAYLFRWDGADWAEDAKVSAGGGSSQDLFGSAVDIYDDRVIVGAPGVGPDRGAAYIFRFDGISWIEEALLLPHDAAGGDFFGVSVALEGAFAVVGANGHESGMGAVYVFERTDTVWTEIAELTASDRSTADHFGISVALSGNNVLIGARWDDDNGLNSGSAYVFRSDGTVWTEEAKLLAGDGESEDYFGFSVAESGPFALVGAYGTDDIGDGSGSVYVFRRTGNDWNEHSKLVASDAEPADLFGYAVDIVADSAIVGSPFDNDYGGSSGSAYLYQLQGTEWREWRKLNASDGSEGDHFGRAVALSDRFAVASAPDDDAVGSNSGSACVFGNMTAVPTAGIDFPNRIELMQNYPNPFNAKTRIGYRVDSRQPVVLRVYDLLGREVATLVNETMDAGTYSVTWDAAGLPSGMYFYRLWVGSLVVTKRMVLIR